MIHDKEIDSQVIWAQSTIQKMLDHLYDLQDNLDSYVAGNDYNINEIIQITDKVHKYYKSTIGQKVISLNP